MILELTTYAAVANGADVTPTRPCKKCNGTGVETDPVAVGSQLRALRITAKKSLRSVAKKMAKSPGYVSDLERGNRCFNEQLIAKYKEALQ